MAKASKKTPSWDKRVEQATGWCHFVQSEAWAKVKATTAWSAKRQTLKLEASDYPLVLYSRRTPGLGRFWYAPKIAQLPAGEVDSFSQKLRAIAKKGVAVQIEPDQLYDKTVHKALIEAGWRPAHPVQHSYTVLIDLTTTPETIISKFKKRARWEISAAKRRGVVVERLEPTAENFDKLFDMLQITSERANFRTRSREYSQAYWQLYAKRGEGHLYQARHEDDVLSMAFVIRLGQRAYYKDGASVRKKTDKFASRLMQWQIMQDMKQLGCDTYDMTGVPAPEEVDASSRGFLIFKTAFGEPVKLQGAYILPLGKIRFRLWQRLEPIVHKAYLKLFNQLWY